MEKGTHTIKSIIGNMFHKLNNFQCINEWRCNVRKKKRALKSLTESESKLLKSIGQVGTTGSEDVEELGIGNQTVDQEGESGSDDIE